MPSSRQGIDRSIMPCIVRVAIDRRRSLTLDPAMLNCTVAQNSVYTLCSEKTLTHIFFHISMNDT